MWMHGDSWWMWTLMISATIGFWVLVALVVQALVTDRRPAVAPPVSPPARALLDARLARGEIDTTEYRRVRELLDQSTVSGPA